MKIGDTVRYLNAVGGGKIKRIDGQIAYVDEDGFETPMLMKELVVVLPAGHEKEQSGARLMFDQKAVDAVKARDKQEREQAKLTKEIQPEAEKPLPVEETAHGEKINITLAFEPTDLKNLAKSRFDAVLVNDSNYFLSLTFMAREDDNRSWHLVYEGTLEPNMLLDLASFTPTDLPSISRITLQCVAFKRDKNFELKPAISVSRKLDLTKFYKMHCFRPGLYFDEPVLELPLIKNDMPEKGMDEHLKRLADSLKNAEPKPADRKQKKAAPRENPNKLLPLQEIDLHIGKLLDSTAGLDAKAMLQVQLEAVRKEMARHSRRIGQKIVFIHGKGDGVLRKAVRDLIKKEYPKASWQDASFQEYGFGATLVTIH